MEKKRAKWGLIFCLPFILTFLVFQLYPIIYSFYLSLTFQENSRNFVFVGFDNYKDLINDKTFWKSVGNTWKNMADELYSAAYLRTGARNFTDPV